MKKINTTKLNHTPHTYCANNRLSNPGWFTYRKNLHLMRLCAVSLLILFSTSCGKTEGERSTTKSNKATRTLSRAFSDANKEMKEFAAEKGLMEDPRVKASDVAFFEAHKEITKIRKSHPDLIPFYEKSDSLENQAIKFKLAKDEEAYKKAMADYKTVRTELERAAGKLPEITEAQKQVRRVREEQTFILCDVVSESGAKGKRLADNVRKLLKQLQASRPLLEGHVGP